MWILLQILLYAVPIVLIVMLRDDVKELRRSLDRIERQLKGEPDEPEDARPGEMFEGRFVPDDIASRVKELREVGLYSKAEAELMRETGMPRADAHDYLNMI